MQVQIGGLSFHGGDIPGPTGFGISSMTGWMDGPGQRRDTAERQGAAGSFDVRGYSTDQIVTVSGRYYGSSLADVNQKGRMLSGLGAVGDSLQVVVDWEDRLWANARVNRVRYAPEGALPWADYQLELWLPDPRKFGEVREFVSTGSNVTAYHRGNAPATPRFKVAASWPGGYRIRGPLRNGTELSFSLPVAMTGSSVDLIDFNTGLVLRNGSPLPRAVLSPQMWTVPGGGTVQWRIEGISGGSGSAVMYLPDTFI